MLRVYDLLKDELTNKVKYGNIRAVSKGINVEMQEDI